MSQSKCAFGTNRHSGFTSYNIDDKDHDDVISMVEGRRVTVFGVKWSGAVEL